jgi:hypothetical protein
MRHRPLAVPRIDGRPTSTAVFRVLVLFVGLRMRVRIGAPSTDEVRDRSNRRMDVPTRSHARNATGGVTMVVRHTLTRWLPRFFGTHRNAIRP